jgi:hypothetical protein
MSFTVTNSRFAAIWPIETDRRFWIPVLAINWGGPLVEMDVLPQDTGDESYLALLPTSSMIVVGYHENIAVTRLMSKDLNLKDNLRFYRLRFAIIRTDFTPDTEIALGSTSADELAELRARRLLLNEQPAMPTSDVNEITKNVFIGGQGTIIRIEKSPFLDLYQHFGTDTRKFMELSWIDAATQLKLSACVVSINKLELTLHGTSLQVSFKGTRRRRFSNVPPFEIHVEGWCNLIRSGIPLTPVDTGNLGARLRGLSSQISVVRSDPATAQRAKQLVDELEQLLKNLPPR